MMVNELDCVIISSMLDVSFLPFPILKEKNIEVSLSSSFLHEYQCFGCILALSMSSSFLIRVCLDMSILQTFQCKFHNVI